jgi:hypothetical protein
MWPKLLLRLTKTFECEHDEAKVSPVSCFKATLMGVVDSKWYYQKMTQKQKGFKLNFGPQHPSAHDVLRLLSLMKSGPTSLNSACVSGSTIDGISNVHGGNSFGTSIKVWLRHRIRRLIDRCRKFLGWCKNSKIFRLLMKLMELYRWVGKLLDLEHVRFKLGLLLYILNMTLAAMATGFLLGDPCFLSFLVFSTIVWIVATMISLGIVGWCSHMWVDMRFVMALFQVLAIPLYGDVGGLFVLWTNRYLVFEVLALFEYRAIVNPLPGSILAGGGVSLKEPVKTVQRVYSAAGSNLASALIHPPIHILRSPAYLAQHPLLFTEWDRTGARFRRSFKTRVDDHLLPEVLLTKTDLALAMSKNRSLTDRILSKPTRDDAVAFLTKFVGREKLVLFKLHQSGYSAELNQAVRVLRKDPAFVFASGDLPSFSELRSGSDFVFSTLADSVNAVPISFQHSSPAGSPDFSVIYLNVDQLCNNQTVRTIDDSLIFSKRTAEVKFSSYRSGQPLSKFLGSILNSKANMIVLASHDSFVWLNRLERVVWSAWSVTGMYPNASLYDALMISSPGDLPTDQKELDYVKGLPAAHVVSGYSDLLRRNTAIVGLQVDFDSLDMSAATRLAERQYRRGELLLHKFGPSGVEKLANLARTNNVQVSVPQPKFHFTAAIPDHRLLSAYQLTALGHGGLAVRRTLGN